MVDVHAQQKWINKIIFEFLSTEQSNIIVRDIILMRYTESRRFYTCIDRTFIHTKAHDNLKGM